MLRRSPVQILSPPPPLCRSAAGGSRGSTTSAANWSKGRRSSPYRTCDRLRRCCPFVAPRHQAAKFFATLRSGENTLHHPRLFAGTFFPLPVYEGEFSQNRCDLSPRFDLVFVATVGNFLFSMQRTHQRRLRRWRHTWRIRIGLLRLAGYVLAM